jgi:hypothetical protein
MEPDRWRGNALVSLVALDLVDPRVFGVRLPGSHRLPELSLRIYVKDGRRHGVRYVRQFVPRPLVAGLARFAGNQPFVPAPYTREGDDHVLRHAGRTHRFGWRTAGDPQLPAEDGLEDFVANRPWVLGKHWSGMPLAVRVDHPRWRVWTDVHPRLDWDPALLFGDHWRRLAEAAPLSIFVAEGSPIEVHALAGFVEGPRVGQRAAAPA